MKKNKRKQSKEHIRKRSLALMGNTNASGLKSEEHKKKTALALMGNTNAKGHKQSKEHILKNSISRIKINLKYPYCDTWHSREYRKDIRKDYCENKNCKGHSTKLDNHHIFLDKKRCAPDEVITLCCSCHTWLHHKLRKYNLEDLIIINRLDHISYIHKSTRTIIRINKKKGD